MLHCHQLCHNFVDCQDVDGALHVLIFLCNDFFSFSNNCFNFLCVCFMHRVICTVANEDTHSLLLCFLMIGLLDYVVTHFTIYNVKSYVCNAGHDCFNTELMQ